MGEITELAETYCNNATESIREGDSQMAQAWAQVAIALNLQRIADSAEASAVRWAIQELLEK